MFRLQLRPMLTHLAAHRLLCRSDGSFEVPQVIGTKEPKYFVQREKLTDLRTEDITKINKMPSITGWYFFFL